MKERPILFSGPMVRALLDGSKTQTRRIVKGWPLEWLQPGNFTPDYVALPENHACPYGNPGDQLWVRETWQGPMLEEFEVDADADWHRPHQIHQYQNPAHCVYAADGGPAPEFMTADDDLVCRWRPSIHMNRWASRILLELTGVRVERLQDISDDDLECEGLQETIDSGVNHDGYPRDAWRALWSQINGAESWEANPWVWVIEFKRVTP